MAKIKIGKQTDNKIEYAQPAQYQPKNNIKYELIFFGVVLGILGLIIWASATYGSTNNKPTPKTTPTVNDLAVVAGSTPEEESQSSTITLTAGEENEYAELYYELVL